jgi:hypothetical protein
VPPEQWIACSAGHGAKGRRLYAWTRVELATPATASMARWLLVRRSRRDGELAFYACYGPAITPLVGLVRVAGTRWAVEEGFEQAKGEEVRRLLVALVWTTPVTPGFVLAWSRWRRRHQARARRAHYRRREQQVRLEY